MKHLFYSGIYTPTEVIQCIINLVDYLKYDFMSKNFFLIVVM